MQRAVRPVLVVDFSDSFKINVFNELVFYVANMSVTRRLTGRPAETHMPVRDPRDRHPAERAAYACGRPCLGSSSGNRFKTF